MILDGGRRRAVYFAFQGLFVAVLILLYAYRPEVAANPQRVASLAWILALSVGLLRFVPEDTLGSWWFQAGLFVSDAMLATLILSRIRPQADLYLMYLLLVFGSALTRSANQRILIAVVTLTLYMVTGWRVGSGWPVSQEFWLRAVFLLVSAALMTVLARDTRQIQEDEARRYEQHMVQIGRLATLGRVAGEVAHRIKGPLTTISVNAEVLAHRHTGDKRTLIELEEIREQVERCKGILKDLLDLGRIEEMDDAPVDLRDPLRRALKSLRSQAKVRRVRVAVPRLDHPLRVRGDSSLLQEAIASLLQNALEAVADGGLIHIETTTVAQRHRVSVSDDGVGIAPEDLERVFEPFFTTKKGQGTGLGLSAALRIASKHGGAVEVDSRGPGLGARFTLAIPAQG